MKVITNTVKGWVKVLPFYLFTLLPLFASCSEEDTTPQEYANWQSKNETYFENQYAAHSKQTADKFILPGWAKPASKTLQELGHTECILIDVLSEGEGTTSPTYTDSVAVHYRGHLIPSPSYPDGYEFDRSYLNNFDPAVDVPVRLALNSNLVNGFSSALQHMHRGDIWQVTIPYQLGYGSTTSSSSSIPAYSTLIFEIILDDFWFEERGDRE